MIRWDRFSRNVEQALGEIRRFAENYGVEINTVEQKIDYSGVDKSVMLGIHLGISEVEKAKLTKRTKEGIRKAGLDGYWTNKAPFGYVNCLTSDEKRHTLKIHPENSILVQNAFEMFAQGIYSMDDVRLNLNFKLARQNFINMLSNPVYIGKVKVKAFNDDPEMVVEGLHDSIIDEELFNRVQQIKKGRKKGLQINKKVTTEFYLKGLLICPKCGKLMGGNCSTGKMKVSYEYYHCNHCNIRYKPSQVHNDLNSRISMFKPKEEVLELFEAIKKEYKSSQSTFKKDEIKELDLKLEKLKSKLNKLEDDYLDNKIEAETFDKLSKKIHNEINELKGLKEEKQASKSNIDNEVEYSVCMLSNLDKLFIMSDNECKRKMVSSIFDEKLIYDENKFLNSKLNKVVELTCLINNDLGRKKRDKKDKNSSLSRSVVLPDKVSNLSSLK